MNEVEQEKIIIQRIISHLNPVPANAVQNLLGQSVGELELVLEKLLATKGLHDAEDAAQARIEEAQAQRASDAAWGLTLAKVSLNDGRRLCDVESNRAMFESLLNPGEHPTAAIYGTLALQFPNRFSWELPRPKQTDADRESEFKKICREHGLSECVANLELFKSGIGTENWAGASQVELQKLHAEAQAARQKWLINSATPSELKAESAYESQTNREQAQRDEATRRHQFVMRQQKQSGNYQELPATMPDTGEVIDSKFIKRLSTLDFPRFRAMIKRYGTSSVTQRLRGE